MVVKNIYFIFLLVILDQVSFGQNSIVGDGFGGRLWYKPSNYSVGDQTAFSICYSNPCDSSSNQLLGWGSNCWNWYWPNGIPACGILGMGQNALGTSTPIAIPNMTNIKYCSAGSNVGVIKNDGTGWVWGSGLFTNPTQVISNVKHLDASIGVLSFVKNDGTVWTMGQNNYGQFGDGTTGNVSMIPIQMQGVYNAVRVATNSGTTYALLADGTVLSTGANNGGLLGNGTQPVNNDSLPTNVTGLSHIVDIKANMHATIALSSIGEVYSWGYGNFAGHGTINDELIPKKIVGLQDIVAISGCTGGHHFLVLDKNKNCYAWGGINMGQIGVYDSLANGMNYVYTPTLVATDVVDIMAGYSFSYLVKSDGSLWCSGKSNAGSSIWLTLRDTVRTTFTKIDPGMIAGGCNVYLSNAITYPSCSSNNSGIITVNHFGGQPPYLFNIGSGTQSSNVFTNVASGNYTVTITDGNLCVTSLTCEVNSAIGSIPVINVNSPSVCMGDSVLLIANGASNYYWSNNSSLIASTGSNVVAFPVNTSTYTIIGSGSNGCSSIVTSTVTVVPLPYINTSEDTICKGMSINLCVAGANTYTWSPSSSLNVSNTQCVIAIPNTTTTYFFDGSNGVCNFRDSLRIIVKPLPVADFTYSNVDSVELYTLLHLNNTSQNFTSSEWFLCNNSPSSSNNVNLLVNEIGNCCVKLVVENNSCYDSISKCFVIYEPFSLNIPNVFTPNNDGKNDFYKITHTHIKSLNCKIYNRWGEKLYEWDGMDGYWDGKTKAGNAPDGIYYYIINYSMIDSVTKTVEGFLTLIR